MLFHEAIARALRRHGIATVFGLIGDGNLFMMDSFQRLAGGQFVALTHEAAVVEAAIGYAHTTGGLGVASVTHGPGLTNTVTPLIEAVRSREPVLLIAGDTASNDPHNLQNIDQEMIVRSTGAGFVSVRRPDSMVDDVACAVRQSLEERRPVVLNVPVDFQWQDVDVDLTPLAPNNFDGLARQAVDAEALDAALGLVASSRTPVVLAGLGASEPNARDAVLRLARRIGAPVSTTLKARELFREDPHNLGIFGTLSDEWALDVIGRSDCVVAFGASLNRFTSAERSLLQGRRVVQIDIDPSAQGRSADVDVFIEGDSANVADTIVEWLDEGQLPRSSFADSVVSIPPAERRYPDYKDTSTDTTVDLRSALLGVQAALPARRKVVIDVGRYLVATAQIVTVCRPRDFVHTWNFAAVGLGMGTAIGACFGDPETPTLLVIGDGGLMLGGLAELSTAVTRGCDLIVLVINDGAFGAEHIQFVNRGMDPSLSIFDRPDFVRMARALGAQGHTVHDLKSLGVALGALTTRQGPVLIDVHVDPNNVPAPGH